MENISKEAVEEAEEKRLPFVKYGEKVLGLRIA
jgi:hypothetical protein